MIDTIHTKNVSMIWTEEYDIIREWDSAGHVIRQDRINYKRYRTLV